VVVGTCPAAKAPGVTRINLRNSAGARAPGRNLPGLGASTAVSPWMPSAVPADPPWVSTIVMSANGMIAATAITRPTARRCPKTSC
jgi:hypothetical protein